MSAPSKITADPVNLIREVFAYQSRFEGSTMVFKVDYSVTSSPSFAGLVDDLVLLANTGFRLVIVPGAKQRIDQVLANYGISSAYQKGQRITTPEAMPFVEMAAFHVATRFMTAIASGNSGTGKLDAAAGASGNHSLFGRPQDALRHNCSGVIGSFVRARGLGVVEGLDFERTGKVESILVGSLKSLLDLGMIAILPCIGWSAAGKSYNVQSDEIALEAAASLHAAKLFIIGSTYPSLKSVPARLTPRDAEAALKEGGPAAQPALNLALKAIKAGVERVHIIDGRQNGAVLRELFSERGSGTMVYADDYEQLRPMREEDIPAVLRIMAPLMHEGVLIRRSADDLREGMADYLVYDTDGSVHACGALLDRGEGQAEIAGLATDAAYADRGLGHLLVSALVERAKAKDYRRVFVLTTVTHDWFEYLGFKEVDVGSLPLQKRERYDRKRNSKIFALDIST
jgi:amino-acid N-acetyltransferase